jgi:hypothetical protein
MQANPVTLMVPQEVPALKAWGDLLKRLDEKVDFAAVDAGTLFAPSAQKSPPGQGGWQMHVNAIDGVDCVDPSSPLVRADGNGLGKAGRIIRNSKPRSRRGIMQRAWTRKRLLYASSIGWPWNHARREITG